MNTEKCQPRFPRLFQLVLAYFVSISAIGGFVMMITDPEGVNTGTRPLIDMMATAFPFASCLFVSLVPSAFALLTVNGLTNAVSIALLHAHSRYAPVAVLLCGCILILWTAVELYAWGFNPLSLIYGIIGVLQMLGSKALRSSKRM